MSIKIGASNNINQIQIVRAIALAENANSIASRKFLWHRRIVNSGATAFEKGTKAGECAGWLSQGNPALAAYLFKEDTHG